MAQAIADLDPTGTLSAATAAVRLVGAVVRVVPAFKNATEAVRIQSGSSKGPEPLHRAQTSTDAPTLGVDSSREKRAYETVNFVLRELGSRICAAGLVNEHALEQALTAATQHVEVNLFSGETNRLFASLAAKLSDPILVNAVFTSIYFIGALTAELARSLPNYKESYTPLGPWIVQQLFRTAIGEDAFRDNLTANLDAYKTVATTAGLLRPTDIGYSSFPGFPAFSPTRYSSRSFGDVRNHKSIYEKLVKHFDKFNFPQPIAQRQGDVGLIRDWRFLSGDSPSRNYDVEKADKTIGETFGRVLHWLICSADRMPNGQAVIAYYLQHIELIKWIGQRMGYSILYGGTDFDMSGAHGKLDKHCRAIFSTWVILMPSEKARATRRASSASWAQTHMAAAAQIAPMQVPQQQPIQQQRLPAEARQSAESAPIIVPIVQPQALPNQAPQPQYLQTQGLPPQVPQYSLPSSQNPPPQSHIGIVPQSMPTGSALSPTSPPPKTIDERLDDVARDYNQVLVPQCEKLQSMPPTDPNSRLAEYRRLTQHIERGVIGWLDGFPIPEGHPARYRRKEMIVEAQQLLQSLDVAKSPPSVAGTPSIASTPSVASCPSAAAFVPNISTSTAVTTSPVEKPSVSTPPTSPNLSPSQQAHPVISTSPPPYSPNTPSSIVSAASSGHPAAYPFPAKKPVRRKAPPPPKNFIPAKAMYDFEPEEDNDEELAFKEGDDIEIIERTSALGEEGWCRARVKGQKKLGLAPLEYLEINENPPASQPVAPPPAVSAPAAPPVDPVQHELHGGESQSYYGATSPEHIPDTAPTNSAMYPPTSQLYGSNPPYQAGYPSSYPSVYPNDPSLSTANNQAPHHNAAGTAAGIASFVHDEHSSNTQPSSNANAQQGPAIAEGSTIVNEQIDPTQLIQNNYDTTNLTQNNNDTSNTIQDNTDPTVIATSPLTTPPAFVDLSAYSASPFDPQLPPNPTAGVLAVDPSIGSQSPALVDSNSTSAPQDETNYQYSPVAIVTSPFVGIATPAPILVESSDGSVQLDTDDGVDDGFYGSDY